MKIISLESMLPQFWIFDIWEYIPFYIHRYYQILNINEYSWKQNWGLCSEYSSDDDIFSWDTHTHLNSASRYSCCMKLYLKYIHSFLQIRSYLWLWILVKWAWETILDWLINAHEIWFVIDLTECNDLTEEWG